MLERLFTFGARRRLACGALLLALSALAVFGVARLRVDTSYTSFMSAHDPNLPVYQRTIEAFGSDNTTIIYLRDEELFTAARLRQIEGLVTSLSNLKAVERVESLFSALNIRDQGGALEVGPLLDTTPEDPGTLATIQANALYSPLLRRNVLSEDGRSTAVTVTVRRDQLDPAFHRRFFGAIEPLLDPLRKDFDQVFQLGPPRLNVEIERAMYRDLWRLTPMATGILVASILLFLGTRLGAVLPLITAGLSILWTFGFMGYCGIPVTLLTVLLPSLLIAIGSAEDTHMMAEYLHAVASGHGDRHQAVRHMARKIGLPIVINSFTTVLGFYANAYNDIILIQQFAYASSFAMAASLVSTMLVLPLAMSLAAPTRVRLAAQHERPRGVVGVVVKGFESLSTRHRKAVVAATAVVTVVFGCLSLRLQVTNDPLSYFKPTHPVVRDAHTLNDGLPGMSVFFLTLEGQEPETFKRPEALKQLEAVKRVLLAQGFDTATSLADFLALVHQEMNQGDPAFHRAPDRQDLIEQYLLFFQREDLERYVDHEYRLANIVVRHHFSASHVLNQQLEAVERELSRALPEGMTPRFVGENLMINHAAESLFVGEVKSLGMLISVIFVIMFLMYTSTLAGVVSLIPNLIPMVITFGTMVLLGIPLNAGTAMVAAIAIGISVDDTTHLLSRYNAERKQTADPDEALRVTVWSEAVPVMTTTVSLALGFLILMTSTFSVVAQFGLLSAITMLVGLVTDMTITPLLLKTVRLVSIWEILAFKVGRGVLSQSRLFAGMSPFQIKKAILLSEMTSCKEGHEIIVQGTRGRSMYLVLTGTVEVLRLQDGRPGRIASLGSGEVFGEVGYSQEIERTATVRATSDVSLLRLDFASVQKALRWYPGIAARLNLNISRILGSRLAGLHARTAHLGLADAQP